MSLLDKSIYTNRLLLRVLDESYVPKVLNYLVRNRDFLKEWEPERGEQFYSLESQRELLRKDLESMEKGTMFRFWLFKREDTGCERVIGTIGLNNIVRGCFQSCHLGYRLDKDEVNKGYTTEGVKAIVDFAFNELKLHRLEANIMPKNGASLRVVEKLGFYNEGLARKYLKINGQWEDHIHMVLLNEVLE